MSKSKKKDLIKTSALITSPQQDYNAFESFTGRVPTLDHIIKPEKQTNKNVINKYRENPLRFIDDWLFINTTPWENDYPPDGRIISRPLWTKQVEILTALFEHKKVAVKSGHGIGKSFLAAVAAITLFYVFRAIGITTAPTFRQVRRVLWGEINKIHSRAENKLKRMPDRPDFLGAACLQTSLDMGGKWYCEGFTTDDAQNYQGFHAERIFLIIDEACKIDAEIYEAVEGILTSEHSYVLAIGNPVDPSSPFRDLFEGNKGYKLFTVPCWDSPNVRHNKNVYPELVDKDWPEDKKKEWGEESPFYLGRVAAEFPEEGTDTLIPWSYLQAALNRKLPEDDVISIGLDVARQGDDRTVFGARHKSGRFRILEVTEKKRETDTAGRAINHQDLLTADGHIPVLNIDDIGVGGGVSSILIEQDRPVNEIRVSESPDKWEDEDDRFVNKRAAYYWNLREVFMAGLVDIDDEELAYELYKIRVDYFSSKGKIKIIEKAKLKKELKKSPDLADDMMLAFALDGFEGNTDLVRLI